VELNSLDALSEQQKLVSIADKDFEEAARRLMVVDVV